MIRIIIADDHPVVREGLRRIIAHDPEFRLVGDAQDGHATLDLCDRVEHDVLLLDVSMPGPGLREMLRRLGHDHPATRVLVVSTHDPSEYAARALRAGAAGYLSKECSPSELADAIRKVHSGRLYIEAELSERLAQVITDGSPRRRHERLSDREHQIFVMLGCAKSVTDIAQQLSLSPKTVSTYRVRILEKMHMRSNAELIRYVIENGIAE